MIRLFVLASLLLTPLVARAQETITAGTITWGLAATFPPFEFVQDGKTVGFDLDLADALTKKMAVKSVISSFEFKGLVPALLGTGSRSWARKSSCRRR